MVSVGDEFPTNRCGDLTVVEYQSSSRVKVEFIKTGFTTYANAHDIRKGLVNDRLSRHIKGVACYGDGPYSHKNHIHSYKRWAGMIARCYAPSTKNVADAYKGCTVCDEWLDFQNFAKWNESQPLKHGQLDKDLIKFGNKIYSPDTCSIVPLIVNQITSSDSYSNGKLTDAGVSYSKGGYKPEFSAYGKIIYLGRYSSEVDARNVFRYARSLYIRFIAENAEIEDSRVKSSLLYLASVYWDSEKPHLREDFELRLINSIKKGYKK